MTASLQYGVRLDVAKTYRAYALSVREGDSLAYRHAVSEMMSRHNLDMDAVLLLGEAAGGCPTALKLLDEGFPAEYIAAMGGAA